MIKNYLKLPLRYLWQSKLYSFINVIGLAVGITAVLLAVLYWKDEHSYDSFHANNPNIYRITTSSVERKNEKSQTTGGTGQVQGPAFKAQVPEVQKYVRVLGGDIYSDIIANNKTLHLQTLFVDESFFDVFTFQLLRGNPKSVLNDVASVVITESTARKFFNSVDVVGKSVKWEFMETPLKITAVIKNHPRNSSFDFACRVELFDVGRHRREYCLDIFQAETSTVTFA